MKRHLCIAFAAAALVAGSALAGEFGPLEPAAKPLRAAATLDEAWRRLPEATNDCRDEEQGFDYWPDGGIRSVYCHARSLMPFAAFARLSPYPVFQSGPHKRGLNLQDAHAFGHYNPDFVRWASTALIPALQDPFLRQKTQPVYDKFFRNLARTYLAVATKMRSRPTWMREQRALYQAAMQRGEADWSRFYGRRYSTFMGAAGFSGAVDDPTMDDGGYDYNLQSAAVAFWLRRDMDGTADLFMTGLRNLLATYDAAWLGGMTKQKR